MNNNMTESKHKPHRKGYDALWRWFGLSHASWLTLPRVLMHEMPDAWQADMARLLEEYNEAYPNQPELGTRVQVTAGGKMVKMPDWLINYRRPDFKSIDMLRSKESQIGTHRPPEYTEGKNHR